MKYHIHVKDAINVINIEIHIVIVLIHKGMIIGINDTKFNDDTISNIKSKLDQLLLKLVIIVQSYIYNI